VRLVTVLSAVSSRRYAHLVDSVTRLTSGWPVRKIVYSAQRVSTARAESLQVSARLATSATSVPSLPLILRRSAHRATIAQLVHSCLSDVLMATIILRRALKRFRIVDRVRLVNIVSRMMVYLEFVLLVISVMQ